jgi:hypothetical protein
MHKDLLKVISFVLQGEQYLVIAQNSIARI